MEDEKRQERIQENIKLQIAMSELGKEYVMKEKKKEKRSFIFTTRKVAVVILALLLITGLGVQAKKMSESYENREISVSVSILDAINNGYAEKIDMNYLYSDGVGLKVNSLFMSENNINFILDFKLNNNIDLEGCNMEYGYILYNEKKEVYQVYPGTNKDILSEFIKENKLDKEEKDNIDKHLHSSSVQFITKTQENVITNNLLVAKEYFPKARKLYLRVVGIGYDKELNGKYKSVSKSDWLIELDIPEKFYDNSVVQYELKEPIKEIKIEHLFISDSSMTFVATIDSINGKTGTCIIDENGKEYTTNEYAWVDGSRPDRMTLYFPINKNTIPNKMFLKTYVNDTEKIIELVKK